MFGDGESAECSQIVYELHSVFCMSAGTAVEPRAATVREIDVEAGTCQPFRRILVPA
jgi:hypothetical protein